MIFAKTRDETIKERLLKEMETYFKGDKKRILHARQVTEFAEKILSGEKGDYEIVLAAAILHDIGIPEAERKYGSSAGRYQEIEGPPIARNILEKAGFVSEKIAEVCEIISHHHTRGKVNTLNFKIIYEADWLVNLPEEGDLKDKKKLGGIIAKIFLTETGKKLAHKIYL